MKTLFTIVALIFAPATAFADVYGGVEADYTFTDGTSQSVGGYAGYSIGKTIRVGPEVGLGVIDYGKFLEGPLGIYGQASLKACLGTKLTICGEGGYKVIRLDGETYDDMFVTGGLSFPVGKVVTLGVEYTFVGTDFNRGGASVFASFAF